MRTSTFHPALGLLALLACGGARATALVDSAAGPDAAAIQATVDQFRAALGGASNGAGGSFPGGRREINWDGVPDTVAVPNMLPPNFFNANSARGAVFASALELNTAFNQFLVSADSDNPTATAVRFANFNPANATHFTTFSAQRLFHLRNGQTLTVSFFVPGTQIPASVAGFGAVFADVDASANARIDCYGLDGAKLVSATAPVWNGGLSFLGVRFTDAGERCARMTVRSGNAPIDGGAADGSGGVDLIALDDFVYGEPRSLDVPLRDGFE